MKRALFLAIHGALSGGPSWRHPSRPEPMKAAARRCDGLPGRTELRAALSAATAAETSGLNNHMWATIVNRDGIVCAVAFSGTDRSSQWPGSRVISAQKANTADRVQPGQRLEQQRLRTAGGARPVHRQPRIPPSSPEAASMGCSTAIRWTRVTPTRALRHASASRTIPWSVAQVGGVNVFGGGLALYNSDRQGRGGRGREWRHIVRGPQHRLAGPAPAEPRLPAWRGRGQRRSRAARQHRLRHHRKPERRDGESAGGFGHPTCLNTSGSSTLPAVQ